ncbi:MAG: hypothetical protein ACR2NN_22575 [Bryobacteraceae bacterium]
MYDQMNVGGTFSAGSFPFIYGLPFPLWFELESIAGRGFGSGRTTGLGSSAANFYNTATIAGVVLYDQSMNPINGVPNITSSLGISYQVAAPIPEPRTLMLFGGGVLSLIVILQKIRKQFPAVREAFDDSCGWLHKGPL